MTTVTYPANAVHMTADSREVKPGSVFLAYSGHQQDGRRYIADAIAQGAVMVLWDPEAFAWQPTWQVANLAVPQLAQQAGDLASAFYQHPSRALWVVGVTGTNGKTTVSQWVAQAYQYLQQSAVVVGTLGNGWLGALQTAHNTTPGAVALQGLLADFVRQQAQVLAMEVSSHGLDQGRLQGMQFDVAVFTNISRDHLDYHQTMAAYQAAKAKLFDWPTLKAAVINIDDAFGQQLHAQLRAKGLPVLSYALQQSQADIQLQQLQHTPMGYAMRVVTPQGSGEVLLHALGEFNVSNALAVVGCLLAQQIPLAQICAALSQLRAVPGRMQSFGGGDAPVVVVDYAHTPDALEKVLMTLRTHTQGKLTCVFGCGGNRDAGKRPIMGQIASQRADRVVLTNDNPRRESASAILQQIAAGVRGDYVIEPDRATAIQRAIAQSDKGDVVLVAGKGHEDYQEIEGVRTPFSDALAVQAALQQREVTA